MMNDAQQPVHPLPGRRESHRAKNMRAHLRFLRHEIRTPINAISGYGEMLQDECPRALLPQVIGDIGALLATGRRMNLAVGEVLNEIDADPQPQIRERQKISRLVGATLTPILAECMSACARLKAAIPAGGDGGEFVSDLFKIDAACQQLVAFFASDARPSARPYETPSPTNGSLDPTSAFVIAQSLEDQVVSVRGRDSDLSQSRILVVDDNASNRSILQRQLTRHGFLVVEVENAIDALNRLGEGGIDLILLDVLLPGMDGLALCRTIKADPVTTAIPVLLVTALHERHDRLAGIAAGANDFLTKPIDGQDLLLRCRNALAAKRQYDRTVEAYRKLQSLEELRDRLTHLIVHDMRSPLAGLTGYLDLFLTRSQGQVDDKLRTLVERAVTQARMLAGHISHVLDVSRLEAGAMPLDRVDTELGVLVNQAIEALGAEVERVPVRLKAPEQAVHVCADVGLLVRVFQNLLSNAIRFSPPGGVVVVRIGVTPEGVRAEVHDEGPGIAPEHHQLIFEKFGQVRSSRRPGQASSGLGLTFCRLAIEAHGGRIGVRSQLGQGSCFWLTVPNKSPSEPGLQSASAPPTTEFS